MYKVRKLGLLFCSQLLLEYPSQKMTPEPSVVLVTCEHTSLRGARSSDSLLNERREISNALKVAEDEGCCLVVQDDAFSSHPLSSVLQQHQQAPIQVLHLATAQDLSKQEPMAQHLANVLGMYKSLKLIILSQCASPTMVSSLLLRDVPLVLATSRKMEEDQALSLVKKFYAGLGSGLSIKESFDESMQEEELTLAYQGVAYDFDADELKWSTPLELDEKTASLCFLKENQSYLQWRLPQSQRIRQAQQKTETQPKNRKKVRFMPVAAAVGMLMILGVLAAFIVNSTSNPSYLAQNGGECPFPVYQESFNVLFSPIAPPGECEVANPDYTAALTAQLGQIEEEGRVAIKTSDKPACEASYEWAQELLVDCNTDLLLWGNIDAGWDDSVDVYLNFAYRLEGSDSLVMSSLSRRLPPALAGELPEESHKRVGDILNEALGYGLYEWGDYNLALECFKQVPLNASATYVPIDMKMAQSYTQLGEYPAALVHYNHALEIDPNRITAYNGRGGVSARIQDFETAISDFTQALELEPTYADAYYNRGLIYLRLEKFEEALSDMEQVIELRPNSSRAFGIKAAIFAHQKEDEKFYTNLELSLQKGLNIKQLLLYTDAKNYQSETRFQRLAEKYEVKLGRIASRR